MTRGFSKICFFIWSILQISLSANANEIKTAELSFYSEHFTISYNAEMVFEFEINPGKYDWSSKKYNLTEFYGLLESKDYQSLLSGLENIRDDFELDDWLYYQLINKSVALIFDGFSPQHQTLICWLLLCKSGFDARITYSKNELYLNVYSDDEIFDVPLIEEDGKSFVNVTAAQTGRKLIKTLYANDFSPNPTGRNFSFNLQRFPKLQPQISSREVEFSDGLLNYKMDVEFDETIVRFMQDYPSFAESTYLEVPFSHTLSSSLLPRLRGIIEGKSEKEALETLVAFTRTAFRYKADEEIYGKSKPMIPDELFHYKYSDCEDRSALFYNLVKKLLDLPMIVVGFPDHVTVAVAASESLGDPLVYNGKKYYICDPTGPEDSFEIGFLPDEFDNKTFEIITKYR